MEIQMKTERLTVRHIKEDDWRGIQSIWMDFNKTEYVIYDNIKNTHSDDVKEKIRRWAKATRDGNEHIFFVSCLEDVLIGFVSLNIREHGYEMGYGFLNQFQGRGYAKESIIAIFDYMKEIGAKKIIARTALKNTPSVKLLSSLGFVLVDTERISFHKDSNGNNIYFEGGNYEKTL